VFYSVSESNLKGPGDIKIFRSRFNVLTAIFIWLLCAVATVAVVGTFERTSILALLGPVVIGYFNWIMLWRPMVLVDDDGVRLINVTRTIDVPWKALIQVDTRQALTLCTPRKRYPATAAPAPGRVNMSLVRMGSRANLGKPERGARPSDSTSTDSGAAAQLVRERWEKLSNAGRIELGAADTTTVPQRWHWKTLALGALLLIASTVVAMG